VLDRRLDARVDDMMSRGLVAELAHFHHLYNERRLQDEIKYRLDTFFFFFFDYFSHSAPLAKNNEIKISVSLWHCRCHRLASVWHSTKQTCFFFLFFNCRLPP
jgi:hypothetical protein